jgi:hypothetical protein
MYCLYICTKNLLNGSLQLLDFRLLCNIRLIKKTGKPKTGNRVGKKKNNFMKKHFKFISMILALCLSLNIRAQWTWVTGTSAAPSVSAIIVPSDNAIDNLGNNYQVGSLGSGGSTNPTFTFGGTILTLFPGSSGDIYLAKSSSSGIYNWALRIGGLGNENINNVEVSAAGDVYISGRFEENSAIIFPSFGNPSTTIPKVTGATGYAGFIAKYNSSGVLQWAKKLTNSEGVSKICIHINSNSTLSKVFAISISSGTVNIQCFGLGGTQLWSKSGTGVLSSIQPGASADNNGNLYGLFSIGSGNFSISNSATFNNPSTSNANLFMCKLDVNGNYIWGQTITAGSPISGFNAKSLGLDANANIYISANYLSSSSISGVTVPSSNDGQSFVAKYNNTVTSTTAPSNATWLKPIASSDEISVTKSVVDNSGNIFSTITTSVNSTVVFNNNFSFYTGLVYDNFVTKHTSTGNLDWALPYQSNVFGSGYQNSIASDNNNGAVVSGLYYGTSIFGNISLSSPNNIVSIHAKINTQIPIFNTTYNICSGTSTVLTPSSPTGSNFKWYASLTSATPLFTGPSFTTPILTANTTYFVSIVIGSGESVRVPVTVTVIPAPSVNAGIDKTICSGACVTIGTSAIVDESFSYSWSIGNSVIANSNKTQISVCPTTTTTYTVTLTNTTTGCKKKDDVVVKVDNISPNFTVTPSYTTPNNYYTIAASAPIVTGVAGFNQTWQVEEVNPSGGATIPGSVSTTTCWANTFSTNFNGYNGVAFTTSAVNPMAGGCTSPAIGQFANGRAYKVTRRVSSTACPVKTATATPSIAGRMGQTISSSDIVSDAMSKNLLANDLVLNFNANAFEVFPNPSNGYFNIKTFAIEKGTLEVYDSMGHKVKSISINIDMSDYQLDLTGFAKGLYIINLVGSDKKYSNKIVIE